MQTMRESWTDERLDDLKESMNERFDLVEARMSKEFTRMDSDIREIRRTMYQGFLATITIMVTCFFGLAGLLFLL